MKKISSYIIVIGYHDIKNVFMCPSWQANNRNYNLKTNKINPKEISL